MANINEFINTAKELADLAGKKAGEAVEVSKLKINNVKINGEIQKTYEKLGAFVYKFRKSGEENNELIDMCVKEIDELLAALEENEKRINETRHKVKCPDCGALNDIQAVYEMWRKIAERNRGSLCRDAGGFGAARRRCCSGRNKIGRVK